MYVSLDSRVVYFCYYKYVLYYILGNKNTKWWSPLNGVDGYFFC